MNAKIEAAMKKAKVAVECLKEKGDGLVQGIQSIKLFFHVEGARPVTNKELIDLKKHDKIDGTHNYEEISTMCAEELGLTIK